MDFDDDFRGDHLGVRFCPTIGVPVIAVERCNSLCHENGGDPVMAIGSDPLDASSSIADWLPRLILQTNLAPFPHSPE